MAYTYLALFYLVRRPKGPHCPSPNQTLHCPTLAPTVTARSKVRCLAQGHFDTHGVKVLLVHFPGAHMGSQGGN